MGQRYAAKFPASGAQCSRGHKWEIVKECDEFRYEECSRCHARQVRQDYSGHRPIDIGWVETGEWSICHSR